MKKQTMFLALGLAFAAGGTASAQSSLSSGFTGGTIVSATAVNTGNMFDLTALNPGGITVNSFDTHSNAPAGTPITIDVYTKPDSLFGFVTDPTPWTLLGTVNVNAAGPLQPTPVALGGFTIAAGQTTGVYINIREAGASVRYYNGTQTMAMTDPANDDLRISFVQFGPALNGLFGAAGTFAPRGWNGTVYYTALGVVETGACCLPDGSCEILGEISCQTAQGTYNGHNTECATIPPCAQPGACCLPEGGCSILSQLQCSAANGVYNGNGSNCAAAACPGGACCLPDGSCVFTVDSLCASEFLGTFNGNGSACGDQRCATLPVLWENGPVVTHQFFGCSGGDVSALETALGTTVFGFGWALPTVAVADSFIVPAGESWTIDEVVLWGYQTGATVASINNVGVQIWSGRPGDPGSTVVAGDITVNSLASAVFTDIYRATTADLGNCLRRHQELTVNLSATLGPGKYWLEATSAGTVTSGPWIAPVKFLNRQGKPFSEGRQRVTAGWQDLTDGAGEGVAQSIPFRLIGSVGSPCYANCDGSTTPPILNVDDFTCFINQFAQAQPLPHAQQVTHYANCDGSTVAPVLNVDDFTCFINEFAQGCP